MGLNGSIVGAGAMLLAGSILLVATHEEATKTCNQSWELKGAEIDRQVAIKNTQIQELETTLVKAIDERKRAAIENQTKLERQREEIALSESCNLCRIPRDRIWLRKLINRNSKGS